jgi:predicted GNAT family N-acyltransferase
MDLLTLKLVTYANAPDTIQLIRTEVFQIEQGVSPELEFDGLDDISTHVLAYWEQTPVGTTRIRLLTPTVAKIERVAVRAAYRNRRIGEAMMRRAIAYLTEQGIPEVRLSSQLHATRFYEKLGFSAYGAEFEEAGIPHVMMNLQLRSANPQEQRCRGRDAREIKSSGSDR